MHILQYKYSESYEKINKLYFYSIYTHPQNSLQARYTTRTYSM